MPTGDCESSSDRDFAWMHSLHSSKGFWWGYTVHFQLHSFKTIPLLCVPSSSRPLLLDMSWDTKIECQQNRAKLKPWDDFYSPGLKLFGFNVFSVVCCVFMMFVIDTIQVLHWMLSPAMSIFNKSNPISIILISLSLLNIFKGICMIIGGLKHREQRFNSRSAGVSSSLLFISIGGEHAFY